MKLIKITCVFLCLVFSLSLLYGCNASTTSKVDVSKNEISLPIKNEAAFWETEEEWDFKKAWKVHGEFEPLIVNAVEEQHPHYSNLFKAIMETHEQEGVEALIHVHILAFDLEEVNLQNPITANAKQVDTQAVLRWFENGNVPVEYENGILHCDISYNDMKKIIEYGKEAGYQLFFINNGVEPSSIEDCLEESDLFECPFCNNNEK